MTFRRSLDVGLTVCNTELIRAVFTPEVIKNDKDKQFFHGMLMEISLYIQIKP
jgi:hypothetical protein